MVKKDDEQEVQPAQELDELDFGPEVELDSIAGQDPVLTAWEAAVEKGQGAYDAERGALDGAVSATLDLIASTQHENEARRSYEQGRAGIDGGDTLTPDAESLATALADATSEKETAVAVAQEANAIHRAALEASASAHQEFSIANQDLNAHEVFQFEPEQKGEQNLEKTELATERPEQHATAEAAYDAAEASRPDVVAAREARAAEMQKIEDVKTAISDYKQAETPDEIQAATSTLKNALVARDGEDANKISVGIATETTLQDRHQNAIAAYHMANTPEETTAAVIALKEVSREMYGKDPSEATFGKGQPDQDGTELTGRQQAESNYWSAMDAREGAEANVQRAEESVDVAAVKLNEATEGLRAATEKEAALIAEIVNAPEVDKAASQQAANAPSVEFDANDMFALAGAEIADVSAEQYGSYELVDQKPAAELETKNAEAPEVVQVVDNAETSTATVLAAVPEMTAEEAAAAQEKLSELREKYEAEFPGAILTDGKLTELAQATEARELAEANVKSLQENLGQKRENLGEAREMLQIAAENEHAATTAIREHPSTAAEAYHLAYGEKKEAETGEKKALAGEEDKSAPGQEVDAEKSSAFGALAGAAGAVLMAGAAGTAAVVAGAVSKGLDDLFAPASSGNFFAEHDPFKNAAAELFGGGDKKESKMGEATDKLREAVVVANNVIISLFGNKREDSPPAQDKTQKEDKSQREEMQLSM